jgi:Spy/CpxP family protein refolding chaperone
MNSTNKILKIAVFLLLLTNIALVIMMVKGKGGKPSSHKREEPYQMMVTELNMTEEQQKAYKAQREEHFKSMKPLVDSLRNARTAFFALVKDSTANDSLMNVYNTRITERQAMIDRSIFNHFKKVRAIFTPEQQPKFDAFVQKMMQRGRRDSSNRKDRDKD